MARAIRKKGSSGKKIMSNLKLALHVLDEIISNDINTFIICPGGRNAPFTTLLGDLQKKVSCLKLSYYFEERAAGFYTLGKARSLKEKHAVLVVTSGTAVAEILPACIEAYYSNIRLIILSADRPKSYRDTGAPQAIKQINIFKDFCSKTIDIDSSNFMNLKDTFEDAFLKNLPIHINVCFDEDLLVKEDSHYSIYLNKTLANIKLNKKNNLIELQKKHLTKIKSSEEKKIKIIEILKNFRKTLIVVGSLSAEETTYVLSFLKRANLICYLEGTSGLKNHPALKGVEIQSGDKYVDDLLNRGLIKAILKIGGTPTAKFWRKINLETKMNSLSLSLNSSGAGAPGIPHIHLNTFDVLKKIPTNILDLIDISSKLREDIFNDDIENTEKLFSLFKKYTSSEPSMFSSLVNLIKKDDFIYLGNSMPIRYWDMMPQKHQGKVHANRGANGIDGQIATALGQISESKDSKVNKWVILGDLTALYDLSSLSLLNTFLPESKIDNIKIVVINNFGGRIFDRIFKDDNFCNEHTLSFKAWAEMFKLSYFLLTSAKDFIGFSDKLTNSDKTVCEIIEIQPDNEQTEKFWSEHGVLGEQIY